MTGFVKVAGVAGWPIHHSLSPMLHNFWLRKAGLKGAYVHFAVRPDEAIHAFQTLKGTTLTGLNVTLPLKDSAYKAADEVTPDAQKLGVSNCLYVRGGKLIAHNTDLEGFAAPLLARIPHKFLLDNPAVLIGAGGASRAVIGALLSLGVPQIRIINRTDSRAVDLAQQIGVPSLTAWPWARRNEALSGAGLIVNATAAGMTGKPPLDISLDSAAQTAWVYDLVYTPLETDLMKQAAKRNMGVIGGLDMLIEQARPSFKIFFGQLPPRDADVSALLTAHLKSL